MTWIFLKTIFREGVFLLSYAVDVADGNNLKKSNQEQRHWAHIAVKDLHPVVPWALREDESHWEGHQAQDPWEGEQMKTFSQSKGTLGKEQIGTWVGFTWRDLIGHPLRQYVEIFEGRCDSLHIAKHWGETQSEEHDEEQYGPHLRGWHLYDGFSEGDESQARPRCRLHDKQWANTMLESYILARGIMWCSFSTSLRKFSRSQIFKLAISSGKVLFSFVIHSS